jgi:hypothetical protein
LKQADFNAVVKTARELLEANENPISEVMIVENDGIAVQLLKEGKWINGRFEKNIRIDQPTHMQGLRGQVHASVYGRDRKNELVVVNLDGSASHGKKGRLADQDAEALEARGFTIRADRMVEWTVIEGVPGLLLD